MRKGWAGEFCVIKSDVCNNSNIGIHNIGCIPSAQHPDLNNCDFDRSI